MISPWPPPSTLNRSVMLGVNPPGRYMYDPAMADAQIQHYSDLCAKDPTCRASVADLSGTMRDLAAHLPKHWLFLPIKPGNTKLGTFYGLMHASSAAAPLSAPQT